jgi:hypothetical protein
MTKRSIPASLAPILEQLELERPTLVTKDLLRVFVERTGLAYEAGEIARRLQQHGWLLSLRTRGVWEFAPASRTGAIGSGDPFIELRATLLKRSNLAVRVAYDSATWLHKFSLRMPRKHVLAIRKDLAIPHALRGFRITRRWANLAPVLIQGLPVWRVESLLVLIGVQPSSFRDWPNMSEWLGRACERLERGLVIHELEGRPRSAWMRTGYVLAHGGADGIADAVRVNAPPGRGPFYLGKRDAEGRYDRHWEVVDSLLSRKGS